MSDRIPNLNGASRVYAVFGDPIAQVQTPALINPLFAEHGCDLFAVPFHVTREQFGPAFRAFAAMTNVAGIGVTIPHKVAAAALCDSLTTAAAEVGAVNSIQRSEDGPMRGALFDGLGFVRGLGESRRRLRDASVLLIGAGGAGRAIAHALVGEGIAKLCIIEPDETARDYAIALVNRLSGKACASTGVGDIADHTVLINASPIGLKSGDPFPIDLDALTSEVLVADIAALSRETELIRIARGKGCPTSDGRDMLKAQIALIAGFAAGKTAGTSLGIP